ncbi:MAG: N-acetylmuramoyl-L-alanine amidase, partial [Actinobacteria bacterium]|nr:N-acetylmuramoyl-L-alanine amidase [Actinomycetota bacterium]
MNKKFNKGNFFRFILTFFVILISLSIIFVSFADKKLIAGDAITIFLDPGHGGSDYGCIHNGLNEKDINLKIALKLKGLLESNGFRVIMRRTSDEGKSLDEVVNMANNSGADLFLSIHNNASLSPASTGTETYWSANGVAGSSQFAASIQSSLVSEIGRPNRGVKTADFKVIKNTG